MSDHHFSVSGSKDEWLAALEEYRKDTSLRDAAPDLLEALNAALPYVEMAEHDEAYKPGAVRKIVNQMRAAIRKAGEPA